jgi:hypothetical protein
VWSLWPFLCGHRAGRTALDAAEQKFDLMYEQLKALKEGKTVAKPIYNHVNGCVPIPDYTLMIGLGREGHPCVCAAARSTPPRRSSPRPS